MTSTDGWPGRTFSSGWPARASMARPAWLVATYSGDTVIRRSGLRPRTPQSKSAWCSAQRDRVGQVVWAVLAVPAHVRAFDGDRVAAEPAVEPAHGAPVGVSAHNLLGEARRAWPAHRGPRELGYLEDGEIKIDCRANH